MKKSTATVAVQIEDLFIVKLSIVMPFLIPLLTKYVKIHSFLVDTIRTLMPCLISNVEDLPNVWIMKQVGNVVKERLRSGTKQLDLLQLMLDAATDDEVKDHDDNELMLKHLHYTEVLMNVFLFMVAGFDTTATMLAFCTYILATKAEVHKKLQAEIDEHWQDNRKELNYDVIANMPYMDMFLREILRMYSFLGRVTIRECNETTVICGHLIEKGTIIMPDVHSVHHNIDLWGPEDVNRFIPERHAVKRHPAALIAFGIGPRNCIGMRFALMALKMSLTYLLHTYNILPGEKIYQGMTLRETNVTEPEAINVRLEKRLK
ncbi:unnamed protein product [Rotaria sordida]|uniref:Cytochrome P450 n=1 Tax=Rotaria sordida TaxID=392033 RepID=A0A815WKS1_9BILA|nr:unnamed protein product [Rotaria sordida]CAF1546596.1 unnamed protein product [Rotaria sordida]